MTALIITESYFGNTAAIGDAIAQALADSGVLTVEAFGVADAPASLPAGAQLLILAAPTHDYSLPCRRTRAQARRRAGHRDGDFGLREWIAAAQSAPDVKVVTVDTAFNSGFLPSSAAKTAARLMSRAGFADVQRGATFCVADSTGPLDDGELIRARAWATSLAAGLRSLAGRRPAAGGRVDARYNRQRGPVNEAGAAAGASTDAAG
ncbi:MAG: hypothetical protein LBD70_08965 [Bifidobacteriaceae bacterium]|jgi:hypothetical protein|nr:hypothetical protein [Bifidobacteriaceae bacterium]